jgi:hypothetical protein
MESLNAGSYLLHAASRQPRKTLQPCHADPISVSSFSTPLSPLLKDSLDVVDRKMAQGLPRHLAWLVPKTT